jgi:hypothetical protein
VRKSSGIIRLGIYTRSVSCEHRHTSSGSIKGRTISRMAERLEASHGTPCYVIHICMRSEGTYRSFREKYRSFTYINVANLEKEWFHYLLKE